MADRSKEALIPCRAGEPLLAISTRTARNQHLLLSLFTLFWGGNFVLAEVALDELSPIAFSAARLAMGALALLALVYVKRRRYDQRLTGFFPRLRRQDWPRLLMVAVVGGLLAPWMGIEGLGLTHAGRASLWLVLGPVLSTGLGLAFRTERLGRSGYSGIALVSIGTFMLAFDGFDHTNGYWLGDLLLLLALASTVLELHLIKPLAARYGAAPTVALRTLIGGTLYLAIASPELTDAAWLRLNPWTWIAIVAGGVIGVGAGQWVKVRALRVLGPTRVVLYGNLVPLATLALAWLALGAVPTLLEGMAGALIISGALFLQVIDSASRPYEKKALSIPDVKPAAPPIPDITSEPHPALLAAPEELIG